MIVISKKVKFSFEQVFSHTIGCLLCAFETHANPRSFTPTPENDLLRRFLTKGALSEECANMPTTCNVCSSRFSPLPHPHTSGNMWAARCDYVSRLIEPKDQFQRAMRQFRNKGSPVCTGRLRYALEHWIHSSPRVKVGFVSLIFFPGLSLFRLYFQLFSPTIAQTLSTFLALRPVR
jgi:hypothetical protein